MDIRRRRSVRGTGGGTRVTPRGPGEVTAPGPCKPNHRGQDWTCEVTISALPDPHGISRADLTEILA